LTKEPSCKDEARVGQKNKITRRWAKRGTRPSAPHDQRTASAYIFDASDQSGGVISRFVGLAKLFAIPPEKGAETIIYLASSPKIAATTGRYFYKCGPITPSYAARDDRAALLLWERSATLADLIT
jgi:hypothetical protein